MGGEGETGKTPEDTVIVFTYQLDVNKTFNATVNDKDLPEFTLYKKVSASDDYTKEVAKVKVVKNSDGKYVASFPRVDDGLYKLVETKVPDGFNKADDTYLEIKATHDETAESPALKNLTITVKNAWRLRVTPTTGTVAASVVNNAGFQPPVHRWHGHCDAVRGWYRRVRACWRDPGDGSASSQRLIVRIP